MHSPHATRVAGKTPRRPPCTYSVCSGTVSFSVWFCSCRRCESLCRVGKVFWFSLKRPVDYPASHFTSNNNVCDDHVTATGETAFGWCGVVRRWRAVTRPPFVRQPNEHARHHPRPNVRNYPSSNWIALENTPNIRGIRYNWKTYAHPGDALDTHKHSNKFIIIIICSLLKTKKKPYGLACFYAKIRHAPQRLAALFFAGIKDGFLVTT